ncbi:hypothetical protein ES703_90635 [subsurface metagenome]
MRAETIEFVDAPVVKLVVFKCAGSIGCSSLWKPCNGVVHIVKIVTEIYMVQFGAETCRPAKVCIRVYEFGVVSRVGVIGSLGRNRKAPDIAPPRTIRLGIIDLIDSPVICRARNKAIRIRKSGKANNKICRGLVALECALGAIVHIVKILAEIYIVRGRVISRPPAKAHPRILIYGTISRSWIKGSAKRSYRGILIILVGGHIVRVVRPHKDIPEHGTIPLPVKDVHGVLAILKLFVASFVISPPIPGLIRFLKDSVIIINEWRCAVTSWEGGGRWESLHHPGLPPRAYNPTDCPDSKHAPKRTTYLSCRRLHGYRMSSESCRRRRRPG